MLACIFLFSFFFFNDTATTEIYTLSLHDALPIYSRYRWRLLHGDGLRGHGHRQPAEGEDGVPARRVQDRKSTRLNSSHSQISYAVFCLKKKKTTLVPIKNASSIEIVSFSQQTNIR